MSYDPNQQPPPTHQFPPSPPQGPYQPGFPQHGYPVQPPPKKRRWPFIAAACVAGLLGLCLCGAVVGTFSGKPTTAVSTTPANAADDPQQGTAKPEDAGADAELFDLAPGTVMTITSSGGGSQDAVILSFVTHTAACNSYGGLPDHGVYLVADVLVKQTKGTGSVNPLNFTFVGDDGTTENSISGVFSGCARSDLASSNALRAGTKRAGQIVFDVSSSAGTVEYAPGGLGTDAVGSWKSD